MCTTPDRGSLSSPPGAPVTNMQAVYQLGEMEGAELKSSRGHASHGSLFDHGPIFGLELAVWHVDSVADTPESTLKTPRTRVRR